VKTRLSVVVPVYNVEAYLDDCLASLDAQDWHGFEAICVNDGSTDGSREILESWAERESWIRIIDKENGGLSSARNAGMREARGEYVCFLDSDDRLLPQACRRIVEIFDASESEVITYGGFALPREETTPWLEQCLSPVSISYGGPCEELLFSPYARPFAWRTALSTEFMRRENVYFDERVGYGEDQVYQFAAYARSKRTTLVPDRLYEYRVKRSGSLMSDVRADEFKMLLSHVRIMSYVWDDYARLGILDEYTHPMLSWACAFVANDALMLGGDECSEVLSELGRVVAAHWGMQPISSAGLEKCELRVIHAALTGTRLSFAVQKWLFIELHRYLYGHLSTARSLLGLNHGLQ
jgi:glycosyltransferase involved in cell wall biosynthesis